MIVPVVMVGDKAGMAIFCLKIRDKLFIFYIRNRKCNCRFLSM